MEKIPLTIGKYYYLVDKVTEEVKVRQLKRHMGFDAYLNFFRLYRVREATETEIALYGI